MGGLERHKYKKLRKKNQRGKENLSATLNTLRKEKKQEGEIIIATFNVRTLGAEEREIELNNALQNMKVDILGLSEVRRFGEAIIEKQNGDMFSYIGETKGQKGVGFIIKRQLKHNIRKYQEFQKELQHCLCS